MQLFHQKWLIVLPAVKLDNKKCQTAFAIADFVHSAACFMHVD